MRIDADEKRALDMALIDVTDEVYLFGSRTLDNEHGGDIDILIFSEEDPFTLSRKVATRFFMECEEKIDVVVINPHKKNPQEQVFLNTLTLVPLRTTAYREEPEP